MCEAFIRAAMRPGMGGVESLFQAEATASKCVMRSVNFSSVSLSSIPKRSKKNW